MTPRGPIVSLLFITALLCATGCGGDSSAGALHQFRLEALDGSRFYLGDHRGKTVVMVFWSVHCVPCHKELADLSKHSLARDDSVTIVSVCVDPSDRALVEQGARIAGGRIPTLLDHDRALAGKLGIDTEPTTLIVDGSGAEVSRIVGYDGATLAQISKVTALIRERAGK